MIKHSKAGRASRLPKLTAMLILIGLAVSAIAYYCFGARAAELTLTTIAGLAMLGDVAAPPTPPPAPKTPDSQLSEAEFQKKVLDGVSELQTENKTLKQQQETLLKNYANLDKQTKTAFEDLTKLKNAANDFAAIQQSIQKVQIQLRREQKMAFGSPIERIMADDELRTRFNVAIRLAVDNNGDMQRLCAPLIKSLPQVQGKTALGEDTSPGSTLIVTDELAREIYDTLAQFGAWSTLGVRRLGTKVTRYPVKTARSTATFVLTEGGAITEDAARAGTSVNLTVEVIASLIDVSRQLLDDAEFDVTSDVMDDFTSAWNERLDTAAFIGDGTADTAYGGMTGLFAFGTAAPAGAGNLGMSQLDLEDFVRCLTAVDSVVLQRGARWWMHPYVLARAVLVRDANGRSIFLTALEAPAPKGIGTILGYPVTPVQVAPSADGASKNLAAFGDPQGLVVGVRTDFSFEASDHYRWNTYSRTFRGVGRAGVKGRVATAFAILSTPAA
jgi:HK97 family phage major capsid protein